jgi:hypothetical protein
MPDLRFEPVTAYGSSNVATFGWQPTDPAVLEDFADAVAQFGSLQFAALAYPANPDGELTVAFLSGGVYRYAGVPLQVFRDMLNAGSRGQYVHRVVKQYPFSRLA